MSLAKTGCKPFKHQLHRVVKHTQTICRILLKICLSLYDLFCGAGDKGLRTSILTFFLTNALLMHCYYAFSLDQVLLFIEICVSLLFPNFELSFHLHFLKIADSTVLLLFFIQNLLSCCGDIEENLGLKYSSLTFCHWNLNCLTAHDFTKISLLQVNITQHNHDIICLTETFLNSILSDDNRITIDGYNLIRSDHPSDSKNSGVCIYYKERIPLISRDDINTLDNYLVEEIRSQNEKCFLTCIYRSRRQNHNEFKAFCTNFDILLNNINDELPLYSIVTGNFNARCSRWWENDITNLQGQELDSLTLSAGYNQSLHML